jgi:protein-S-isoprenylcysteine O-methyltransferase Ste14
MTEEKSLSAAADPLSAMPPVVRLLVILVFSALNFALAILGWGGVAAFFAHTPLVGLAIVTFALAVGAAFVGGNLSPGVREDRSNRWVITAFSVLSILDGFLPAFTDRHDFWTFDGDAVRWSGVALYGLGGALRLWPVHVLGRRFSGLVAIQPGHTLVTDGVYRYVRHPSYLGLLITVLGWGLAFRSGVGILIAALHLIPLVARMNAEERLLRSEFGEEYAEFFKRTSRLVPGVY